MLGSQCVILDINDLSCLQYRKFCVDVVTCTPNMMCVLARQGITVHAAIMSSIWSCGQLDVCEFFISTVHIQFDTCYVSSTKIRSKSTRQRGMTFSIYSGHKHLNYLHVSLSDIELAESCPHSDLAGPCRLSARTVWTWAPGVHLTGQSF